MSKRRAIIFLFFLLLLSTSLAFADYVEVRRAANIYVNPDRGSDTASRAEIGANLHLLEAETHNGYYHVEDPKTGTQGWIYRSFVRRFPGDQPQNGIHSGSPQSTLGQPFPLNACKLPYNEKPAKGLAIESCGLQGEAEDRSGEAVQNPHKNNLCVTGPAQVIGIDDLAELQSEVDDSGMKYGNKRRGKSGPPLDRAPLTSLPPLKDALQLGEGSLVTFVGYLADAHYSPASASSAGETVNCKRSDHEEADIHISLSADPGKIGKKDGDRLERLCKSISAEFIPHARPDIWDVPTLNQVINLERPVRVTGHLFFDASHEPCRNGKPVGSEPRRISSWEIHPIYTFEVCKFSDLKRCSATSNAAWQPMSGVSGVGPSEEDDSE